MRKDVIVSLSDAQAVNFREISMGIIAPNTLYRSSHPVKDNKQDPVISTLASNARIAAVLNLCDTGSGITGKALCAPWYNRLLKNHRVIALGMDFDITGVNFREKLKNGLQFIIATEGPWLIHCYAGIDRTGFVCMVLESFMGAALDDVINDYLKSFNSMFESSIYETYKTDSQVAMQILSVMDDSRVIDEQNLRHIAETYLHTVGLSAEETELLKQKLAGRHAR